MAEQSSEAKQDNFEDSSSSGEWTFVERTANLKETKDVVKEELKKEDLNEPKSAGTDEDPVEKAEQAEEALKPKKKGDAEEEHLEKGEESSEKDAESDDVSVITDEETELTTYQEKRIEKLERNQVKKTSVRGTTSIVFEPFDKHITLFILAVIPAFLSTLCIAFLLHTSEGNKCVVKMFEVLGYRVYLEETSENLKNVNQLNDLNCQIPDMKNIVDDVTNDDCERNTAHTLNEFVDKILPMWQNIGTYGLEKIPARHQEEFIKLIEEGKQEINDFAVSLSAEVAEARRKLTNDVEEIKKMEDFKMRMYVTGRSNRDKKFEKEEVGERSKGEVKNHWKKNKFEDKEKQASVEKKYFKRDKYEIKKNNNNNKDFKQKREYDASRENHERNFDRKYENKRNDDYEVKYEYEKKNRDADRQSYKKKKNDYHEKKDRDNDYKNKKNKKDYDYDRKFDDDKRVTDYDNKSDYEKNYEQEIEYSNKKDNSYREHNHKKHCESDSENNYKCGASYQDDFDNDVPSEYHRRNSHHYSDKNNLKKKYLKFESPDKYFDEDYVEREKEKRSGEWLMERSNNREKQRNSDWYSARADSRQWSRTEEEQQQSNKHRHYHHPQRYRSLRNTGH